MIASDIEDLWCYHSTGIEDVAASPANTTHITDSRSNNNTNDFPQDEEDNDDVPVLGADTTNTSMNIINNQRFIIRQKVEIKKQNKLLSYFVGLIVGTILYCYMIAIQYDYEDHHDFINNANTDGFEHNRPIFAAANTTPNKDTTYAVIEYFPFIVMVIIIFLFHDSIKNDFNHMIVQISTLIQAIINIDNISDTHDYRNFNIEDDYQNNENQDNDEERAVTSTTGTDTDADADADTDTDTVTATTLTNDDSSKLQPTCSTMHYDWVFVAIGMLSGRFMMVYFVWPTLTAVQ